MTTLDYLKTKLKGGAGSGHHGHGGRPGKRGGSSPGKGGITVWTGQRETWEGEKISKLRTGEIGEEMASRALAEKFGADFQTLNKGINNAPIDVLGDGMAVEVKTGLTTNGKTAQHWRATIGQPGKTEAALIKRMTPKQKRAHNVHKREEIIKRKETMLGKISEAAGREVKGATVGVILSPDGKRGDVFMVPGFHSRLTWNQYATDEYHLGSYEL